jgi:glycosyltransferase involved in cell wall biosynthesis
VRIAQIAPLYESVPPEAYGGTERVIAALCDGLTARGHEVVLFATDSSETDATLEAYGPPLRRRMTREELADVGPHLHLRLLEDVYRQADQFDVVHSHVDVWTLPFAGRTQTPTVVTLHGRLDIDQVRGVLPLYPDVAIVSISDAQREPLAGFDVRWATTVYNGLDLSSYASSAVERRQHLAFLGRICPEKRPDLAIEVAQRTGRALEIAAKVDPTDVEYHQTVVEPRLRDGIEFLGEIDETRKADFLAGAAATLFPSDWPEPFGLVMIESMAAGTPVIALRRGSVPEVVADGVSGFICDDVDDMVDAVSRLDEIDPEECRRHAARFAAAAMCEGYERVYDSLVREHASATRVDH